MPWAKITAPERWLRVVFELFQLAARAREQARARRWLAALPRDFDAIRGALARGVG